MCKNGCFAVVAAALMIFSAGVCAAQSEGEKEFCRNNPGNAIPLLEKEIQGGFVTSDSYNYLGLAYFQTGDYDKAIDAFERGLKNGSANKKLLYFNEGNLWFAKGDFARAEGCYNYAVLASPEYYPAILNRANARLNLQKYRDACDDYKRYVAALPDDGQVEEIRRLIGYLEEEIVAQEMEALRIAEEERRLKEENERLQAELARQEAERQAEIARQEAEMAAAEAARQAEIARQEAERKAAEEERRRILLEEIANSLNQTDTTNMTAGTEDVIEYDYESEIE